MNLNYSSEDLAFRDEVTAWLTQALPTDLHDKVARYAPLSRDDLLRWHRILAHKGWVAPSWPEAWGGTSWTLVQRYIFEEACGYVGTPPLVPFGLSMCAPVLLKFGNEMQKQRFLPRCASGEWSPDSKPSTMIAALPSAAPVLNASCASRMRQFEG